MSYEIQLAIRKLEAIANEELYWFPENDPDSWGYCIRCDRNSISCECYDTEDDNG